MKNVIKRKCLLILICSTALLISCEGKNNSNPEKTEDAKQLDSLNTQKDGEFVADESKKPEDNLSYDSYQFAENLKNDSFYESDNLDKTIELKNVGITSYFIGGDEVSLIGIFYNKEKNMAIPRFENNPPGRGFVPDYFNKNEIKYDEKYKSTFSSTLRITLKNPKDVRKLKMYIATEPVLNYEYKVDGTLDQYRSGFVDIINVKGTFKGLNADSVYPNKNYEITNAEIN